MAQSRPPDVNVLPAGYRPRRITPKAAAIIGLVVVLVIGLVPAYGALTNQKEQTTKAEDQLYIAEQALVGIQGQQAGLLETEQLIREVQSEIGQLTEEFGAIGQQLGTTFIPEDWTYQDVLAWLTMLQRNFDPEALDDDQPTNAELYQALVAEFGVDGPNMFQDLRWTNDPEAQTYIVNDGGGASAASFAIKQFDMVVSPKYNFSAVVKAMKERRNTYINNLKDINAYVKMGSYAWVDVDGELGIQYATQHLIALGHRRIAIILPPADLMFTVYRRKGFYRTMETCCRFRT